VIRELRMTNGRARLGDSLLLRMDFMTCFHDLQTSRKFEFDRQTCSRVRGGG
jgi:hypothetical protein